jgi:hypothetical protein
MLSADSGQIEEKRQYIKADLTSWMVGWCGGNLREILRFIVDI